MIICSCSAISSEDIKDCIRYHSNPTPKSVLKSLGWISDCNSCCDLLVKHIREEINNIDHSTQGEQND